MVKALSAIEFMHGEGLVHRNIKAENILIFDPINYTRVGLFYCYKNQMIADQCGTAQCQLNSNSLTLARNSDLFMFI